MGFGKVYDTSMGFSHTERVCTGCRMSLYREYEGERYWCPTARCYVDQDLSDECEHYVPIVRPKEEPIERNDCKRIEDYI